MHKNVFTTNVSKVENIYRKAVINETQSPESFTPRQISQNVFLAKDLRISLKPNAVS